MLPTVAVLVVAWSATLAQYAYHSKSPYGPWDPIMIATPPNVSWPPGAIWYGKHCNAAAAAKDGGKLNPLDCGGNNPSPYIIDSEAAVDTGFAAGTVVIATTWQGNYSYGGEAPRMRSAMVVGTFYT